MYGRRLAADARTLRCHNSLDACREQVSLARQHASINKCIVHPPPRVLIGRARSRDECVFEGPAILHILVAPRVHAPHLRRKRIREASLDDCRHHVHLTIVNQRMRLR